MIEPLNLTFEVACSAEHAFATWTARIGSWWPADHTVSGERCLDVILEPGIGGRIYERTQSGEEHQWGEVTVWEPPARLAIGPEARALVPTLGARAPGAIGAPYGISVRPLAADRHRPPAGHARAHRAPG